MATSAFKGFESLAPIMTVAALLLAPTATLPNEVVWPPGADSLLETSTIYSSRMRLMCCGSSVSAAAWTLLMLSEFILLRAPVGLGGALELLVVEREPVDDSFWAGHAVAHPVSSVCSSRG